MKYNAPTATFTYLCEYGKVGTRHHRQESVTIEQVCKPTRRSLELTEAMCRAELSDSHPWATRVTLIEAKWLSDRPSPRVAHAIRELNGQLECPF